jgi:hypothetical protein
MLLFSAAASEREPMAENQGKTKWRARLDRPCSPDIRGFEESAGHENHLDDNPHRDTSAEGRDRPPSNRGRDRKSPWLGGG